MQKTVVELEGVNGEWFTLAGPQAGDKGVYLATGVSGLFDPPVKASYEEPGNYPGARYLSHRVLRRDLIFAVHILEDGESWLSRDSEWRKAWAFDRDSKLYVTTDSGTRYLKVRLFESPDVDTETDPNGRTLTTVKMVTVAGDPFWYGEDVVYSAVTKEDTTFNPYNWGWPWPKIPVEDITITVDPDDGRGGLNPTDQYIFPKWTVPGSAFPPAFPYVPGQAWLGAPKSRQVIWTLPDYSFEDPKLGDRRLKLPGLIGGLRTDEVQAYNIDGIVEGGTYRLKFGSEETPDLAWNANRPAIKAALEATSLVAYNDVEVDRGRLTNEVQVIELEGTTGGTFTLQFAGQVTDPIPFNATDLQLYNALRKLSNITLFDLKVRSKVTNEQQYVTLVGEPLDGTFTLTFDGQTTDPINWNATALEVYNKLVALPNLQAFDFSVKKDSFRKYAPWVVTFSGVNGQYRGIDLPAMVGDPDLLEGGAGMDVVVSTETEGSRPYVITFRGLRAGQNVPELVPDTSWLTGPDPKVNVRCDNPGSYPYVLKFGNNLSGKSLPLVEVVTTNLTGPVKSDIGYRSWKITEGNTAPAENCVVDTDPRVEQVTSESGSPVWSRMNGVRFKHPIPPYTRDKTFKISVSGATKGEMVTLRLPRPWSRPWGLE